ncbi:uncharacterized protein UTRI_03290 [Ustilago trichophora]|uniref:Anti-proliferative protein domain-containing protein n=1 Tax=Ustilago trichophora TaxID=86804 RepID=A0A5C3E759_9BASI|nr:uncharacterized protein UTRI_03290 [Ustilago trichophora]
MIYEVAAAVEHILSLISQIERQQPVAPDALAGFASTLKDALEKRCQKCWNSADPERGSAQRSVAWQLHAAGEGADKDLLRAFASVVEAQAEEGEIVHPHQAKVVALALEWLPLAFTMWIDPGCVAVRRGAGPGATRSSYDFDPLKSGVSASSIHVVWGQMMVANTAQRDIPQLTVSSAPRPIPIVKPTPQLRYPVHMMNNARPTSNTQHNRALSTSSSSASSSCDDGGLVRSVSLSSTHTISTDATSLSGLEADADSETCPSLCSPKSSLASSQCTPNSDNNDHESVHDTTIGDTTQRFTGVRLFDDDEEEDPDDAGDVTIDAAARMLGLNVSKDAAGSQLLGAGFVATPVSKPQLAKSIVSSTPVKCNYTTHDNGNVGVLGGGVRLGGSTTSKSTQPPRHRQHSNSKSISHLQAGLHNQLLPPMPYMAQRQMHHLNSAANYSAPMRTIPLPPAPQHFQHVGYQQQQQQQQPQQQQQQVYATQPQRAAPVMMGYGNLPTPYGFRPVPSQQQQQYARYNPHQQQLPMMMPVELAELTTANANATATSAFASVSVDDDEESSTANGQHRRRLRSRGRRSRGRGAGRAARRQAAALRALELESTDELPEFSNDEDDYISRCSTPATLTDYTDSSCYSSVTCSPAKLADLGAKNSIPNLKLQHQHHHHNVEFGLQLHSNLARLQMT